MIGGPTVYGMGGFSAQAIADSSVSGDIKGGKRLVTMQLRYPRFIHAEFMTHRVFSRNASSSRAIPVAKMLEQVRDEPARPLHWGKNQPGMQAREELTGNALEDAQDGWTRAANLAANIAEEMMQAGAHKQVVNRILEPFQFMHVIVTSTEWDNFFELRDHEDADPNIQHLARIMKKAMDQSMSVELDIGEWHLPYITLADREAVDCSRELARISAARCARVSFLTHEGKKPLIEKDLALFQALVGARPLHASPTEHQAELHPFRAGMRGFESNLKGGWVQHRKYVEKALAA